MKQLSANMKPGSSTLFVLVRKATPDKCLTRSGERDAKSCKHLCRTRMRRSFGRSEAIDACPEFPREFLAEGDANGVEYQAGTPFRRRNRIALHVDHHRAADHIFAGRALSDYAPRLGRRRRLGDGDYHGGFIFRIYHRPRTITRDGG